MDVHCSTCGEPWDTWHLWQDAIYDTALDDDEADAWRGLSRVNQLSPRYRESFKQAGWAFGKSVLDVRHCPCCVYNVENLKHNPDKIAMKAAIIELLGDDEDAIAAAFEEEGL